MDRDNTVLSATCPLGGYTKTFDDTQVSEVCPLVIVSISVPRDGLDTLNAQLNKRWQVSFPAIGQCTPIDDTRLAGTASDMSLYGLQSDQCFLVAEPGNKSTQAVVEHVCAELEDVAYLTDQSDSWAVLDVQGPLSLLALERICMLDLASMNTSQLARTTMEHLSVIVRKPGERHVRLYSPRSSAMSFLHAVTTSVKHVTTSTLDSS